MKQRFTIEGLDCPNCAAKLAGIISGTEGISDCKINFLTEKITVESDMGKDELLKLLNKVSKKFESGITVS